MLDNVHFDDTDLNTCRLAFSELPPDQSLFMSHYELAAATEVCTPETWKRFLTHPTVAEWIAEEVEALRKVQMRKVIKNAADNERSVGAAQMMTALAKVSENTQSKEGNILIYSYVPLNDREQEAPNTHVLQRGEKDELS